MTFKHKLAARLARLWTALSLFAIVATSCEFQRNLGGPEPGALDRLELSPPAATLETAAMTDFVVVGLTVLDDTVDVEVTWSATGGVVTDTSTNGKRHHGRYKAGSQPGNYRVIARDKSSGTADTAAISVVEIPVAAVVVSPAAASVAVGATAQLTASTSDASGNPLSGRVVTWASSNAAVAAVNGTGLVTGVAAGSATITATSEGQSDNAAITVTSVPAPVASVSVTPATAGIPVGQTVQLTATPRDANGNALSGRTVTWLTSNASVATVSGSGLVTGVAVGSATITATSEGQNGTAAITVTAAPIPVASVDVNPSSASLYVGQTVQLTATPRDANGNPLTGRTVTWTSGNTAAATVSSSGVVTGRGAGSATITATSEGQSGTAAITVATVPVASVTVTPSSTTVPVGGTVQLTGVARDSAGGILSGRPMAWSSSNAQIATVVAGLVTGVAAGTAYIIASSDGKSDTATVTVEWVPVASVTVSPASRSISVGQVVQFTATVRDAAGNPLSGRTVTWSSSDPTVAPVSSNGFATGIAVGSATITATAEQQSGNASVTVTAPLPIANGCPSSGYQRLVNVSTQSELTSALGAAQPGDQIRLAAGLYGGFSMGRSGTSSDPIVICSNAGGTAILKGLVTSTGSYLMIAGLVFEGPSGGNQVYIHSCHHVVFTRNEIRYGNHNAGLSVDDSRDMTITYNYIHHNGAGDPSHHHGIYFKTTTGPGTVIANNLIANNVARGLSIHDNTGVGAFDLLVAHNTIVGNGSTGILANDGDRHTIVNNIVAFNGGANPYKQIRVISGAYPGDNNKIWNNVTYSTNASLAGIENTTASEESGNVIANPLLMTLFSDLHLRLGSPAIGRARMGYATIDYDGKTRDSAPDVGAYEFITP